MESEFRLVEGEFRLISVEFNILREEFSFFEGQFNLVKCDLLVILFGGTMSFMEANLAFLETSLD